MKARSAAKLLCAAWLAASIGAAVAQSGADALPASREPLKLKPSGNLDAFQLALKAVLIGVVGVAAAGGGLYAWRNFKGAPRLALTKNSPATVEWARRVTPRTTLMVVQWNGKRYLLAEGVSQTQLVDSHEADGSNPAAVSEIRL